MENQVPEGQQKIKKSPYVALQYPEFRAYMMGNSLFTMALLMQEVVLGYEVYKISHDPLALGLIGLAEALPYISLALFGGHVADRRDKKTIMLISLLVIISGSVILIWATNPISGLSKEMMLTVIYFVIFLIGLAKGFFSPAASSLNPFLVPKEVFANAATWSSSFWQFGAIVGPGVAGFLYAYLGLTHTLWIVTGLLIMVMILISFISKRPVIIPEKADMTLWESLKEGIVYVFKTKIILYSISLDLFSVLFGGVIAILPIFAEDILKVGAEGLGILRAAPSIGALVTMVFMVYFPPTDNAWRNLLMAVAGFGIATIIFALSTFFWLSAAALFLTGAFDSVSVIVRQTVLRHFTPDEMRGRVSAVNGIFVSSSNEIGAFESGLLAKIFGTVPSVLLGGAVTISIVSLVWIRSKELFKLKIN
ncbi:Predicted arabinose efflux permease, MFS family [Pseudarcicella hirudinis]|uniref:Predicted arabinose efflux permease, MFS family n=1 Tax=Pseudarcicella hirudinis TaxID=1079859 RepID=A0A1I5YFI4_9BACT|nr:MFS transporter [Pseudarcicella hirudinis]SFQ42995.1 Predicted arabinose efflux permease, MFS family [Pseudarcicella hirudinis]